MWLCAHICQAAVGHCRLPTCAVDFSVDHCDACAGAQPLSPEHRWARGACTFAVPSTTVPHVASVGMAWTWQSVCGALLPTTQPASLKVSSVSSLHARCDLPVIQPDHAWYGQTCYEQHAASSLAMQALLMKALATGTAEIPQARLPDMLHAETTWQMQVILCPLHPSGAGPPGYTILPPLTQAEVDAARHAAAAAGIPALKSKSRQHRQAATSAVAQPSSPPHIAQIPSSVQETAAVPVPECRPVQPTTSLQSHQPQSKETPAKINAWLVPPAPADTMDRSINASQEPAHESQPQAPNPQGSNQGGAAPTAGMRGARQLPPVHSRQSISTSMAQALMHGWPSSEAQHSHQSSGSPFGHLSTSQQMALIRLVHGSRRRLPAAAPFPQSQQGAPAQDQNRAQSRTGSSSAYTTILAAHKPADASASCLRRSLRSEPNLSAQQPSEPAAPSSRSAEAPPSGLHGTQSDPGIPDHRPLQHSPAAVPSIAILVRSSVL